MKSYIFRNLFIGVFINLLCHDCQASDLFQEDIDSDHKAPVVTKSFVVEENDFNSKPNLNPWIEPHYFTLPKKEYLKPPSCTSPVEARLLYKF